MDNCELKIENAKNACANSPFLIINSLVIFAANMNFERFIARRAVQSGRKSFTRMIIIIATLAVALSLTVMIATTALISGFKTEITDKIFGFWGHIHITDINSSRSLIEAYPVENDGSYKEKLEQIEGVEYLDFLNILGIEFPNQEVEKTTKGGVRQVQTFAMKPGIIQTKNQIEGIILKGVGADFDWSFLEGYLEEGSTFQANDSSDARKILISRQTADRLETGIGKKFLIHFINNGEPVPLRFEVAGIYKTGLEEYDKKFAIVDISVIQGLLGWESNMVTGYEVFVENIDDLNVLADYIDINELPNHLYAETIREKFPPIFEWLNLQNLNETVILVLMLIVSIINMITALLILILERTEMIGVLKSLGSSNWSIRKIFLNYAGFIILSGLFWGNVVGIGLCLAQKYFGFIKLSEADYYLSTAPIALDFWTILFLNIGTLIVTLIFLVVPTWLVTRISPVKAIRFR